MDAAPVPAAPRFVAPDRATPRIIGVLNIVFGILLTLFVLSLGLVQAGKAIAGRLNRLQTSIPPPSAGSGFDERQDLQDRIEAAMTEAERDQLQRRLDALPPGGRPAPVQIDIAKALGVSDDPRFVGYHVVAVATGLLLNVMLIVAGVRLVGSPPRGRVFNQWVCGLKIARLVLVEGFYVLAVVPLLAQMQEEMMQSIAAQMPPGAGGPTNPAGTVGAMYAVMYTVTGLTFILLGVIYPVIVLWLFNKPAVKAAFGPPTHEITSQAPRAT